MDCSDCVIGRGWHLCGNWRNHSCRNHPRCVLSLCSRIGNAGAAIMAAISNASQHGFLVRRGNIMERLAKVDTMTFDKTGTLTYGTPEVTAVETVGPMPTDELYRLVASVETKSEHPLYMLLLMVYWLVMWLWRIVFAVKVAP